MTDVQSLVLFLLGVALSMSARYLIGGTTSSPIRPGEKLDPGLYGVFMVKPVKNDILVLVYKAKLKVGGEPTEYFLCKFPEEAFSGEIDQSARQLEVVSRGGFTKLYLSKPQVM